ncbi:A-kinase anchor protein 14 isoform X2 [Agelaius phoeniceus]|uniref:A-kinase anchor protein 14 isoform X2 n=1 Tax=Agelaius phoeniceus TaxID=39638 RepID=UPI004054D84D
MVTARRPCPRGRAQRRGQRRARAQLPGLPHLPRHRSAPGPGPRRAWGPPAWPGSGGEAAAGPGAPSGVSRAGVKPMEEEKGEAGSEEKDHIPPEDESSSTEECLPEDEEKEKESKHVIKNIPWTTAKNFTVEIGQQQIEELISTWDIHESWLHHSEFLEEEELKDSKRYHYRACWGLPTRRKPIPRATASVYFVIVISKLKPDGLYLASALSLLYCRLHLWRCSTDWSPAGSFGGQNSVSLEKSGFRT